MSDKTEKELSFLRQTNPNLVKLINEQIKAMEPSAEEWEQIEKRISERFKGAIERKKQKKGEGDETESKL